jgi:AcrR family transcriptional regulator
MSPKDIETREKLIQVAQDLLNEEEQVHKITARRITERAGVGLGSINYHFQSKDNLLNEAVARIMGDVADQWLAAIPDEQMDPKTQLRRLLKETSNVAAKYPQLSKVSISYALNHGGFDVQLMILPLLREIFGQRKTELEIKLAAFQIIAAMQVGFLHEVEFRRYVGVDITQPSIRDQIIDLFIDNLIS